MKPQNKFYLLRLLEPIKLLKLFIFILFLFCLIPANYHSETSEGTAPSITILSPHPNTPVIVRKGESFSAELKTQKNPGKISGYLSLEIATFPIQIEVKQSVENHELITATATVPPGTPEELYDLVLGSGSELQTCRRCVKVIADFSDKFYFVHISDVHVVFPILAEREGKNSSNALFEHLAEEISIINPAFVLITGDVTMSTEGVTRVVFQKGLTLGPYVQDRLLLLLQEEFGEFLRILNQFRVPTFVIPGNHDMTGTINPIASKNWLDVMGKRYFSFDFGGAHFIGFDNSAQFEVSRMLYGDHPDINELDAPQLAWLDEDLKKNQDKQLKVFFYHCPFGPNTTSTVPKLADRYGVKLALAGHLHDDSAVRSGTTPTLWLRTASNEDFGAYRLVRINGGEIASWGYDKPLLEHAKQKPDAAFAKFAFTNTTDNAGQVNSLRAFNFDVQYSPSNDGTAQKITAAITNTTPETFENALLRFRMPKAKNYTVTGGKLLQIIEGKNFNLCYVNVNIAPNGKQTVSIAKQ